MPPQFFKDAHGGLNNKFVPRFSLNLGGDASASESDESSSNVAQNSSVLMRSPVSVSTAPSTGASSKFFLTGSNDNGGGNRFMFNNQVMSETGGEHHGKVDNSDGDGDTDDDLQITEIRTIDQEEADTTADDQEVLNQAQDSHLSIKSHDNTGDQTSGDLLLDALYKSQKLCGILKNKLEEAHAKTKSQEDEIDQLQRNKEALKSSFRKFKENLLNLEQKSSALSEARNRDTSAIKSLKSEYKAVSQTIERFKAETANLKKKVDYLQQLKLSTKYEIEKRNKEISSLQKKLDETSGFLSEQKIKTSELERALDNSRTAYDKRVGDIFEKSASLHVELATKMEETQSVLKNGLMTHSEAIEPIIVKIESSLSGQINALCESFTRSLDLNSAKVSDNFKEVSLEFSKLTDLLTNVDASVNDHVKRSEESRSSLRANIDKLLELMKLCSSDIRSSNSGSTDLRKNYDSLLEAVSKLQCLELERAERAEKSKLKVEEDLALCKSKVTEYEKKIHDLTTQVSQQEGDLAIAKQKACDHMAEIATLTSAVAAKDSVIKSLDSKLQQCKVNCDAKIKTQMEVYKMVTTELDAVKSELSEERLKHTRALEGQTVIVERLQTEKGHLSKSLEDSQVENRHLRDAINKARRDSRESKAEFQHKEKKLAEARSHDPENGSPQGSDFDPDDLDYNPSPTEDRSKRQAKSTKSKVPVKSSVVTRRPINGRVQTPLKEKSTNKVVTKRKTLLDDKDLDTSMFDDFDFDNVESRLPSLPKRYTKRKKTNS